MFPILVRSPAPRKLKDAISGEKVGHPPVASSNGLEPPGCDSAQAPQNEKFAKVADSA
jgi:hypothetical protein